MSLVKTHTTEIGGVTYTTETLPASQGIVIFPKLLALLGERLAALLFATQGDPEAIQGLLANPKVMGQVLVSITERAAETDGLLVLKEMLTTTTADKVRVGDTEVPASVYDYFDAHFQHRYVDLFQVAFWVCRINFIPPSFEKA